jgi:hypothetical protein
MRSARGSGRPTSVTVAAFVAAALVGLPMFVGAQNQTAGSSAPGVARRNAIARPMPRDPPVTTADLPERSIMPSSP